MILKPPPLRKGDRVGILAPAGPVSPGELAPGIERLKSFGLDVALGPHLYESLGYTAGDDDARLEDLHVFFQAQDIRGIFCARGGYGSLRLLPLIDFDVISSRPKVLMGFSDITALLMGLHEKTGLVSFHGPVVRGFVGKNRGDLERFFRWMEAPAAPPVIDLPDSAKVLVPGMGTGKVFGGNLSTLSHLVGTGFLPDLKGAVLFLEEVNEPLYRIDRMLTHLHLAGVFRKISAFLFGDFSLGGDESRVHGLLMKYLDPLGIPVVSGLPVGHGTDNIPLPMGVSATLDTGKRVLSFAEPCFSA